MMFVEEAPMYEEVGCFETSGAVTGFDVSPRFLLISMTVEKCVMVCYRKVFQHIILYHAVAVRLKLYVVSLFRIGALQALRMAKSAGAQTLTLMAR